MGEDGAEVAVDFSDHDAAEAWFARQSPQVRSGMACRAALRVVANISADEGDWRKTLALPVFRSILISGVRWQYTTPDISEIAGFANAAARAIALSATLSVLAASRVVSLSAAQAAIATDSADDAARSTSTAIAAARSAANPSTVAANDSLSTPAAAALSGAQFAAFSAAQVATTSDAEGINSLGELPLWPEQKAPPRTAENHEVFLEDLAMDPETWGWWREWYLAMWEGWFTDWPLALEIAQIEDALWEGDDAPQKIADRIRILSMKHALLAELETLKAQLPDRGAFAEPPAAGHNQGPPLDDAAARETLDDLWDTIEELEEEAKSETPKPSRLKELGKILIDISVVIAKYCGGKTDIVLTKSAETIGTTGTKWAIGVATASLAAANPTIQSTAKAAFDFAKALLGG